VTAKKLMRGSLHCAGHDEAVNGFGRDDGVWWLGVSVSVFGSVRDF
jgi:hypothetical protein